MKTRTPLGLVGILVILLCWPNPAKALEAERAEAFLQGLLDHPDSLETFVDPDDLAISRRLGIRYPEASCKPLISWDLSPQTRERLRQSGLDGQFTIENLDDRYSRLILFPADSTATRSWIFRGGRQVSSILYQVRGWRQIESPHFRFFVSDSTMFHPANIEALEKFLSDTAAQLGMSETELDLLAREKIIYCFCSNQDEIRELTGFFARGMYIVSHDLIVSTYSAHFHELAHLLINFKLKQPHLYTHPFFLEGFAVAAGGRGGKSPDILHQLGLSNIREEWVTVEELRDPQGFYQVNASMSYPASGVFNRFLLENLGAAEYLELYSKYGGGAEAIMTMRINQADLPPVTSWKQYLNDQPTEGSIKPGAPGLVGVVVPVTFQSNPEDDTFNFAVPGTTLIFQGPPAENYRSFLYEDFFQDQPYDGQRFFIRASTGEVAVYDLFTNTMIALYATGFSVGAADIPLADGLFRFQVDKDVFTATIAGPGVSGENFDENVKELNLRIEFAVIDGREWPKYPGGLAGFLFGQDSVCGHGCIYYAAVNETDHDEGRWREATIGKTSDGTWKVISIRACEESDFSDLKEQRDYLLDLAKKRVGLDFANQGPLDLLDLLKRWESNSWLSPILPFGWVKESDLPALVEFLDSSEPCANVQSMVSSFIDNKRSTVGNEAAYLIEGFRKDWYPPRLNSTRPKCDIEEIKKWWKERQGT